MLLPQNRHNDITNCYYKRYYKKQSQMLLQQTCRVYQLKYINTAVQLGQQVRFLYHSNTNYTKRGVSVAASGKPFDY